MSILTATTDETLLGAAGEACLSRKVEEVEDFR